MKYLLMIGGFICIVNILYDKDIFLKENFREVSFCYGQNKMGKWDLKMAVAKRKLRKSVFRHKNGAIVPVVITHLLLQQP